MTSQGKAYTKGQKEFIVCLKQYFDKERANARNVSTRNPSDRVAKALDVGICTVKKVVADFKKSSKVDVVMQERGKPIFSIGTALETKIRQRIRYLNLRGKFISVRSLKGWIYQECDKINIPVMTLWRTLKRMGFVNGTSKRRNALKERDYVIIARREYIRIRKNNRKKNGKTFRPEVYLDETYINVNYSKNNTWYLEADGPWVNKPSGKGPRLIIVNAITKDGWVPNAKLVFLAKKNSGDYHGQMNWDNFSKWFTEKLLPNIPHKSLIFMDNAKYHNVFEESSFPTPNSKKSELQDWLKQNHKELYSDDFLKPELFKICKKLCPLPKYKLDVIAESHGHTIIRTPQYHPELQPIEIAWGLTKDYCAIRCDYTMANLKKLLDEGFEQVTPAICKKLIKKVIEEEDKYWIEDETKDNCDDANVDDSQMSEKEYDEMNNLEIMEEEY